MAKFTGGSGNDVIDGGPGNDVLDGNGGNDVLDGKAGADVMRGGAGNDLYFVDNAGDRVVEAAGEGTDRVISSVNFSLAGRFAEKLTLAGGANLKATGNDLANVLTGNSGNNVLNGGVGADIMRGGAGNDTYRVDNAGDMVIEANGQGTDRVVSSVNFSLAGRFADNLTLAGSANLKGIGNELANLLLGNSGNNVLTGGAGADMMRGRAGNDTYHVDDAGDRVIELDNQDTDRVISSVSFSLNGKAVENLTLTGTGDINASGNGQANTLLGNSGNNVLNGRGGADVMRGRGGNDTYYVDDAGDRVTEVNGQGTDRVISSVSYSLNGKAIENLTLIGTGNINATGNDLANVLAGNSGNNVLNGRGGADVMRGRAGNDTYYVDNVGDSVVEADGQGTDLVRSSISDTLSQFVENLTLTGSANIDGVGNDLANMLTGNSGDNVLDGNAGADVMRGGVGDDTFMVDNTGDRAIEMNGQGTDQVLSSANYTLSGGVEDLTLTGNANIKGTGNNLANSLTGNSGNNVLNGRSGADVMTGGAGDDTYYVDNLGDQVIETNGQGGADRIFTSLDYTLDANQAIETLRANSDTGLDLTGNDFANTVIGGAGDDTLRGAGGNDTLRGGAGDDTLIGGPGDDTLTGGAGADRFVMELFGGNDTITDFDASSDRVDLSILGLISVGAVLALSVETGNGVQLGIGLGLGVNLLGVQLADLNSSNILV